MRTKKAKFFYDFCKKVLVASVICSMVVFNMGVVSTQAADEPIGTDDSSSSLQEEKTDDQSDVEEEIKEDEKTESENLSPKEEPKEEPKLETIPEEPQDITNEDIPDVITETGDDIITEDGDDVSDLPPTGSEEEPVLEIPKNEEEVLPEVVVPDPAPVVDPLIEPTQLPLSEDVLVEEVVVPKETWSVDGDKATTNAPVELNVDYKFPGNEKVVVKFTKLPENAGTLSIEEIKLTNKQVASLGALSNKAYDITSTMKDGTFEYELTLPKPKDKKDIEIKYAENISDIKNAETIEDVKISKDSVKTELDHFTVFFVVGPTVSIELSIQNPTLIVGDTQQFDATITAPADPGEPVIWSSSNTTTGTIDSNGLFTALAPGTSVVTASITGATASTNVTVNELPVLTGVSISSMDIFGPPYSMASGTSAQFDAFPVDQFGNYFSLATLAWSSSNTAVATVDPVTGMVNGLSSGDTTLTVSATDGINSVQGTLLLSVTAPSVVTTIYLSSTTVNININGGWGILANAIDQYGLFMIPQPTLTWTTSDPTVATITSTPDVNGFYNITGVGAGTATLTVSSGGVSNTVLVTVNPPRQFLGSIVISPAASSDIVGNSVQFSAVAYDTLGNLMTTQPSFFWQSSNLSVATISSTGLLTLIAPGNVSVTAFSGAISGSTPFTSNPIPGTFGITASAGANGSISPVAYTSVVSGGSQSYTITSNAGYAIADVLVDGVSVGAVSSYTFTNVLADHTITASFNTSVVTFGILAAGDTMGSISPSGFLQVPSGSSQTFTMTAYPGAVLVDVWVDGVSVGAVSSYTFTNVSAGHTINAFFDLAPQPIPTLFTGWNLIGWMDPATTADAIGLANPGVDVVSRWDAASQLWVSHVVNFPINNFMVNTGDGIFVHKN